MWFRISFFHLTRCPLRRHDILKGSEGFRVAIIGSTYCDHTTYIMMACLARDIQALHAMQCSKKPTDDPTASQRLSPKLRRILVKMYGLSAEALSRDRPPLVANLPQGRRTTPPTVVKKPHVYALVVSSSRVNGGSASQLFGDRNFVITQIGNGWVSIG
jgi:hypothetical protein